MVIALSAAAFTACGKSGTSTEVQEPAQQEETTNTEETPAAEENTQTAATENTQAASTQEQQSEVQEAEQDSGYESEETPVEPQNAQSETTITTSYFTVNLPADWAGQYEYSASENDDGSFWVTLYEASDYETNGSGLLFSIALFPEGVDYSFLPNFGNDRDVTGPNGAAYKMVVISPSDVQFSIENQEKYMKMYEQASAIAADVTLGEGYSFN